MDVVVVGCGASGIAAIRRLHDAGLKVLGLEAADRIGGRIHSVDFGVGKVDLGAAWCHGEKGNVVYELANPLGLLGRPERENKFFVLSNGDLVPTDTGEEILNAFNEEVGKADKNTTRGIDECVINATYTNPVLKKDHKLTKYFLEWYERNNHLGGKKDPKTGKSLKGLIEFWNSEGDPMLNWKGKGFATILDVLLNKIPDPSKAINANILLNKEVESIKWSSQKVDPKNPLVHVKCKDGSLYAAKSVIITVSVGVLKERHTTLFSPPLPSDKINTINNLQFCILGKIYIEFERPWWPEAPANFTLLWRDEDKAKFTEEYQWITEVFGMWSVHHQPNVLLAWTHGEGTEKMEKVSLEGIRAGVEKLLDILRTKFDVAPVKNVIRSQWASNPLARGAYAYRSVAIEENGGSAEILSEPLYHGNDFPIVCFAGEATSHHRHTAVHGAVEAGFREADRLIESFKTLG
ncbi:spermine oxidase-like isoform X2 [Choristoneura fumiferana]